MGEFTSAEDAIAELYDAMASDPYDDTQDALRDHLQDARDRVLSDLTALRAENARLRKTLGTIEDVADRTFTAEGVTKTFYILGLADIRNTARAALDSKEGET